jgi:hypothetical protein
MVGDERHKWMIERVSFAILWWTWVEGNSFLLLDLSKFEKVKITLKILGIQKINIALFEIRLQDFHDEMSRFFCINTSEKFECLYHLLLLLFLFEWKSQKH